MVEAEESFDLSPSEDSKPTGARMEKPEQGVVVTLDASQISVIEEMSGEEEQKFLKLAVGVGALAVARVQPRGLPSRMFRLASFLPVGSLDQAMRYTVEVNNQHQAELGSKIGMTPSHKKIDYIFSSGSLDVSVVLSATTFESVTVKRVASGIRASEWQKKRAERLNIRADKLQVPSQHAVMLEVGITEYDPPTEGAEALFERLRNVDKLIKENLPKQP